MPDIDTLEDPRAPYNDGPLERAMLSPVDGRRIVVRYERMAVPSPAEDITNGIQSSVFVVVLAGLGAACLIITLPALLQDSTDLVRLGRSVSAACRC